MQLVSAVTQFPAGRGQWTRQRMGGLQYRQVMAGNILFRRMCLGPSKRGKMGLALLPMGWDGGPAGGVSDALMFL